MTAVSEHFVSTVKVDRPYPFKSASLVRFDHDMVKIKTELA